jgi:phosphatidylserine decarboxylase
MEEIKFKVRGSDDVVTEKVPGGGFLSFLYGGNPLGKLSLFLLVKRKVFSVGFGKYMSSSRSKKKIAPFVEKHKIDLNEYFQPQNGYQSFNDFFYRNIKPTARPIQNGVVSPADGRVVAFNLLSDTKKFFVKGAEFNLQSFLNDDKLAAKYKEGAMLIVRLAPVDYHRYHFPVSGVVGPSKIINGYYYSVSPLALRKRMEIFCQNQREYSIQSSKEYGEVLICDVGATLTGGIVQTYQSGELSEKGSEKGYFAFGGSTIILLFEKGKIKFSSDLISNTNQGYETFLKMGETIGE